MNKFVMVLGESTVLPGAIWTQYDVELLDKKMVCTNHKNSSQVFEIFYDSFKECEFGIGNGNLWLQCELKEGSLCFCSPRKCWKSEEGKYLIEKINQFTEIKDMKEYKQYTGKFFFLAMFK